MTTRQQNSRYSAGSHYGDLESKESTDTAVAHNQPSVSASREAKKDGPTDPEKGGQKRIESSDYSDPFEDDNVEGNVKYKSMKWWQGATVMIAETISLGILSLPSVMGTIGLVPGIVLILGLGLIATYTGYVLWQFKMRYPHVVNMADVGQILFGRIGYELFGAAQVILLIFSAGSHILTWTIAFNVLTGHATCTIVWAVVALMIFFICTLPRKLEHVSYLSIAAFISILSAVMITMVGVGIEQPDPNIQATVSGIRFATAFVSVTNIVFAYIGHVAFFAFIAELRDPKEFPKALYVLQAVDISLYLIVSVVVYRFAGADVASPALGSTAIKVEKVAYGIALPTIIVAGVIYIHVAAKYIYVRVFRGTKHLTANTWLSYGVWVLITGVLWTISFIIAESIPSFNDLLALISSLFGSWFTYGLSGSLWLFLNEGHWFENRRKSLLTIVNFAIVVLGAVVFACGLYASGDAIHRSTTGSSWSCADNSKSG